jgi:hypothetical protein
VSSLLMLLGMLLVSYTLIALHKQLQPLHFCKSLSSVLQKPQHGAEMQLRECPYAGLEWSAADPWVFASLSYDGRVMVNRVPSQIKYKILI